MDLRLQSSPVRKYTTEKSNESIDDSLAPEPGSGDHDHPVVLRSIHTHARRAAGQNA